ncbi:MAG: beta-lactamase family protein, partial [Proteobacteria bacterium]|nr:beta-lactamase family protein [Pseudomonadota bacterium]
MSGFAALEHLLAEAVRAGHFPGAVALAARGDDVRWRHAVGRARLIPDAEDMTLQTVFDLASLTKPLATTATAMVLHGAGRLDLDRRLEQILGPDWLPPVKAGITIRHLLTHSSGLPDLVAFHRELFLTPTPMRRPAVMEKVFETDLIAAPGSVETYSDVGFLALQAVLEHVAGRTLDELFTALIAEPLGIEDLVYRPFDPDEEPEGAPGVAATWDDPERGLCWGRVEDENAWFLGGVAGHAGLFGPVAAVHCLLAALLRAWHGQRVGPFAPATVREFFRRQGVVSGSDWALGFDTP